VECIILGDKRIRRTRGIADSTKTWNNWVLKQDSLCTLPKIVVVMRELTLSLLYDYSYSLTPSVSLLLHH
jgi:hypothetical protein